MAQVNLGVSVERCLKDMPYEILFEIFRRVRKGKLTEISRLCSKFRDIAGDTRLWKDVYIEYKAEPGEAFAFEELYSEPWPVYVIDLFESQVNPPVTSKTGQAVKVYKLSMSRDMSTTEVDKVTMDAILTKYQCTDVRLEFNSVDLQGRIMGIALETFSKQTALERLSLVDLRRRHLDSFGEAENQLPCRLWLLPILSSCTNLKSLDLSYNNLTNDALMSFVEHLPPSLEKLELQNAFPQDSFFELLAKICPNLKGLGLYPTSVGCPSLFKFKFLEILEIFPYDYQDVHDLYLYIKNFPALKTVRILFCKDFKYAPEIKIEKLRKKLEPHGIIVAELDCSSGVLYSDDDINLWTIHCTDCSTDSHVASNSN